MNQKYDFMTRLECHFAFNFLTARKLKSFKKYWGKKRSRKTVWENLFYYSASDYLTHTNYEMYLGV